MLRRMLLILFGLICACTNIGLQQLDERVNDNFVGTLPTPADINPNGANQFSFMIVGDTHVGSPNGETLNQYAQISYRAQDSFMIIAGDVTHGGSEGEYAQFKQVMSNNSVVWRVAIGNHDIFFDGWSRFKTQFGRSIYSFNADNVHFAMVDTANGVIGQRQLEWLENDLKSNTREHVIIVTHFPPWNGSFSSIYRMSSEEEAAIFKDMADRYRVDIVFSGHYHGYEEITLGHTKYIVSGGANGQMDLGQRQNYVRVKVNGSTLTTEAVFP